MSLQIRQLNQNNINFPLANKNQNANVKKNQVNLHLLKKDTITFKGNVTPESIGACEKVLSDMLEMLGNTELSDAIKRSPQKTVEKLIAMQNAILRLTEKSTEFPRGFVERIGDKLRITSFDKDKGIVSQGIKTEIKLPEGIKFFEPGVSPEEIKNTAFEQKPFVVTGPVGWTNVKPTHINPKTCDMKFFGENPAEQANALQRGYQKAFEQFITPVYKYLEMNGLKVERMPIAASFSDYGIDQIAMTYAKNNNIGLIATGPYRFAEYISQKKEFPFPIALTNTVEDYGMLFSKLADITLVTGGRDHAFLFDTKNQFIGNKGTTLPVDLLKMYYGIEIPALKQDGLIENAAALLKDLGLNPFSKELKEEFKKLPKKGKELLKNDEQKALATVMHRIYKSRERAASLMEEK